MTKCDRCEKETREPGILSTLELKALGMYPTDRLSLGMFQSTITFPTGGVNIDLGSTDITINDNDVTTIPNGWLLPRSLHKLPGRPINAYLSVLSVAVRVSIATAVAAIFNVCLLFEDTDGRRHVVAAYTNTAQEGSFSSIPGTIIFAPQMQEKPIRIGRWIVNGSYSIGGSSGATLVIQANYGILYGAPVT